MSSARTTLAAPPATVTTTAHETASRANLRKPAANFIMQCLVVILVGGPRRVAGVMQERGVEPLHLSVQAPKTCASANSATPAGDRMRGFSTIFSTVSNEGGLGGRNKFRGRSRGHASRGLTTSPLTSVRRN